MSKVVGLTAGRAMGNSEILLKYALKAVEEEGHEISLIRLHDYYIKPCTGCELCTKLARGGEPIHCMYKWDQDDFYFLMSQLKEAEGLILAMPCYHMMPPGILTTLMNRLHSFGYSGFFAQQHVGDPSWKKVVATIGVGGSDWQTLMMPVLNFAGTELICSQLNLVDQLLLNQLPAKSMVATRPEYLARASKLGKNLAMELGKAGEVTYHGDRPEVCPICHTDILAVRDGRVACPICDVHGDIIIEDGKIKGVKWDGGLEVSRFSAFGSKHHDDVMLKTVKFEGAKGYQFTDEQKAQMKAVLDELRDYLPPVKPDRNPVQEK